MNVKSVGIYKPSEAVMFEVGANLKVGEEETSNKVVSINVNVFKTVTIKFSNDMTLVFKGLPISYEK